MNKIKKLFVLCCTLITITVCSLFVGCELKGELFDKSSLKRCDLEFLQKPENVTNEVYSIEGDNYKYNCEIGSKAEFTEYAESVMQGFIDNKYTFGYLGETVELGDILTAFMFYNKVYPSLNLEDYSAYHGEQYSFRYIKKPLKELKKKYGGRFMGHKRIVLNLSSEPNENGKYEMDIMVHCSDSNSEWGNYYFEKEQ